MLVLFETLAFMLSTILVCLSGDYLVFTFLTGQAPLLKALADSFVHGSVAFFSWLIIEKSLINASICTFMAMLVDVDHFIQAGSWRLEDAISLNQRPFLHNSTLPLSIYLIIILINLTVMGNCAEIKTGANIAFVAFFTHHLRDASRRGLWFEPWVQSLPVAYPMYIFSIILLCIAIKIIFFNGNFVVIKLPMTIKEI